MINWEALDKLTIQDLVGIPYKENGRSLKGLDCYGATIFSVYILEKKKLIDVWYDSHNVELAEEFKPLLNVSEVENIRKGIVLEMHNDKELHIGTAINENLMIHATINQGVRISRIGCLPVEHKYKVV